MCMYIWFLPARRYASAGISRHRVSVCMSHASIISKRLNVVSCIQCHVIARGLARVFWRCWWKTTLPPEICSQSDPPPFWKPQFWPTSHK